MTIVQGSHESWQALITQYRSVRRLSQELCAPLALDDYQIQTIPEVSPPKWHLAHVTWFFETFLLKPFLADYHPFHPRFEYLFNSYYETVGQFHPRRHRGLLSRPTLEEVYQYRAHVDSQMEVLLESSAEDQLLELAFRITLGLHHEQQHQELLLMDIKHNFAVNPLRPSYHELPAATASGPRRVQWHEQPGGLFEIGHGRDSFAYDNETPRHPVYLGDYSLASSLVTNGEYLEFMEAGGYQQARYWLADGWNWVNTQGRFAPLYWERIDGWWWQMTLGGMRPVNDREALCHVTYYEADAFARWSGKRLPTEAELEAATCQMPLQGNFMESRLFHPSVSEPHEGGQWFGDLWEWTQSPYVAYPGFRPLYGSLGEYNGKFMCNQMVMRGGSCVTPQSHMRVTYRNFFYPHDCWQFSGFRLAKDG
jgi:ergothioneine biosynthesis protein EgtB